MGKIPDLASKVRDFPHYVSTFQLYSQYSNATTRLQCFLFFFFQLWLLIMLFSACRNLSYISVSQNLTHHSRLHSDSIIPVKTFLMTPCRNICFIIWNLLCHRDHSFRQGLYKTSFVCWDVFPTMFPTITPRGQDLVLLFILFLLVSLSIETWTW